MARKPQPPPAPSGSIRYADPARPDRDLARLAALGKAPPTRARTLAEAEHQGLTPSEA
ncbi:MAG TPA: hypothetical protein VKC66_36350 [Xanthobacteraceae bacterium]|nr:hypothetical protein [Xanthobacteraceae bacterium]